MIPLRSVSSLRAAFRLKRPWLCHAVLEKSAPELKSGGGAQFD